MQATVSWYGHHDDFWPVMCLSTCKCSQRIDFAYMVQCCVASESMLHVKPGASFRIQCCVTPCVHSSTTSHQATSSLVSDSPAALLHRESRWLHDYTTRLAAEFYPWHAAPRPRRSTRGTMSDSPQTATENSFMSNDALFTALRWIRQIQQHGRPRCCGYCVMITRRDFRYCPSHS
jgi:hypothetical protein